MWVGLYNVYLYYLSALGNVGTTKAVLSESSDDSNQALSMVILTSALGTGLILGPAVSGAIYRILLGSITSL